MSLRQERSGADIWPVGVAILAMAGFQSGAALGKTLFPAVGPEGATALRVGLSAVMMNLAARSWRGPLPAVALRPLLVYGLTLAGLNGFFYHALKTVPLGIAVAIDFLGPLGVALAHSRQPSDAMWGLLAAAGLVLLLPGGGGFGGLDPAGLAWCLAAAVSWAAYILAGRRVGLLLPPVRATALGMVVATAAVLPFGVAAAGPALLDPAILPLALAVAVLSSALPYTLEMIAMTRLPARLFGVLMSLEPALAALFGFLVLSEALMGRQLVAIGCVVAACAGATVTASRRRA